MDLETVLKKLNLTQFYLGEMHRRDLYAVTRNGTGPFESELVSQFINDIIHFNERCLRRVMVIKDNSSIDVESASLHKTKCCFHPLDISTVLFLCCDNVVKQDIVQRLWSCKLAFPFVIKAEQLDAPILYLWSTVHLVHNFPQTSSHVEDSESKTYFKNVSFIRFGQHDVSKSNIINILLNETEKIHSVFYHRNCDGSSRDRSELCDGMIEVFPHFDSENGSVLYFNLRGESNKHSSQRNFLKNISDVIILLCRTNDLELIFDFVGQQENISFKKLIIIFTDLDLNDAKDSLLSNLDVFSNSLYVTNNIIAYKGLSREELKRELMINIIKIKGEHTFDDIISMGKMNLIDTDIDAIKDILICSETFSKILLCTDSEGGCANTFPLQDEKDVKWCKLDLEKYKLRLWDRKESIRQYRERLEQTQLKIRKLQLDMIADGNCETIDEFVKYINKYQKTDLDVFLRNVKLIIEKPTHLNRLKLYEENKQILHNLRSQTFDVGQTEKSFKLSDEQMDSQSLSLINLTRELGKIYEIKFLENFSGKWESLNQKQLLDTAVNMLMCGYEIEIMDGRSNWVPIQWVKGILTELKERLGNIRIKVITVLGVQSSGKSTLLNTMFGSNFAVGAGRCTRGMSMYLVKVSDYAAQECLVDYILVIDTEGLYSSVSNVAEASERDKKERELATFAIGLAHVTIVNIMGENLTYLEEILPITVHAFLRMDLIGLRPKCRLLHHNVNKGMQNKLLQQTSSLQRVLDKYTDIACSLENVPSKSFSEVIHFDAINDVDYFAPYFENVNSLDIVSSAYSKDVMRLKENLMSDTSSAGTLEGFLHNVDYLWNAVKKDDFVFEFRNTIETKARIIMDKRLCNLQWKSKKEFQEDLDYYVTQAADTDTLMDLNQVKQNYLKSTEIRIRQQEQSNDKELRSRAGGHELLTEAVRKLYEANKMAIKGYTEECMHDSMSQFNRAFRYIEKEIEIMRCNADTFRQIDIFLAKHMSPDERTDIPILLFNKWLDELWHIPHAQSISCYEDDAADAIYEIFSTRRTQVDKIIQVGGYFESNIETFLTEIPQRIWPYGLQVQFNEQVELERAIKLVKDTQRFVKDMLLKLQNKSLYYRPNLFKDIALEVRNHYFIFHGEMHTKPDFEIELVAILCGEFIRGIKSIPERGNFKVISERLMKKAKNYFISRCRLKSNILTNKTTAVEHLTDNLKQELETAVMTSLSQNIADDMKDHFRFLESKQVFLIHTFIEMLECENVLSDYLLSFETCITSKISKEFNNILRQDHGLKIQNIINRYTGSLVKSVCENLVHEIEKITDTEHLSAIGQCVEVITLALKPFIAQDICSLKQFELDKSDDIDPTILLRQILANLQGKNFLENLNEKISELVKGTYYNKIRNETVEKVLLTLSGCTEKCPLCGEPCCIGLRHHAGEHHALMHKPTGFQGKCRTQTKTLDVSTCWEELEHCTTQRQRSHITEGWTIPTDVSVAENSFWKFMFVTHVKSIAFKYDMQEPDEIPDSWRSLTKSEELEKLKQQLRTFTAL